MLRFQGAGDLARFFTRAVSCDFQILIFQCWGFEKQVIGKIFHRSVSWIKLSKQNSWIKLFFCDFKIRIFQCWGFQEQAIWQAFYEIYFMNQTFEAKFLNQTFLLWLPNSNFSNLEVSRSRRSRIRLDQNDSSFWQRKGSFSTFSISVNSFTKAKAANDCFPEIRIFVKRQNILPSQIIKAFLKVVQWCLKRPLVPLWQLLVI